MAPPPDEPDRPRRPDAAMADPMLRVLRERHPEVDVVVLPRNEPAPAVPTLDAGARDTLAADVEASLDGLLARVVTVAAPIGRDGGWHTDEWGQQWYESVAVVGPLEEGLNVALLRATGHVLVGLGWQARPVPGSRPRLEARRRGGLTATAAVRPDALVVKLRTVLVRPAAEAVS
ncbi:hypothetical protein KDN32_12475 [Nocardioides sp. J2M5]|uniref:hypothetical protein n=1 Tax=Nocardioides palaemonis TaxID=2829810 RepID=UPI001BA685F2|nr:hypothetical protein [Nocardioides palaemonis]MBS2938557.1 hypothetical protein [Nocardioides palaemonis]